MESIYGIDLQFIDVQHNEAAKLHTIRLQLIGCTFISNVTFQNSAHERNRCRDKSCKNVRLGGVICKTRQ